jgi:proteasome lid subunit RPN8/RPN11
MSKLYGDLAKTVGKKAGEVTKIVKDRAMDAIAAVKKQFANFAPKPQAKCPAKTLSANDLLNDKNVKAGLKKAAADSDIGGKNPVEHGGFILQDPETCDLSVARWPQGKGASIQPVISKDGKSNGLDIVGSFHTHPNVGPGWVAEPSTADINFVKNYPQTAGAHHFVVSQPAVYHVDNKGTVSNMGKTSELLK